MRQMRPCGGARHKPLRPNVVLGAIFTAARKMARGLMRRHGFKPLEFEGINLDHPGESRCETVSDRPMTTTEQECARWLAFEVPGLRIDASALPPRYRTTFTVALPRRAEAVKTVWEKLASTVRAAHRSMSVGTGILLPPPVDAEWFCIGFLQALSHSINHARDAAKMVLQKETRKRRVKKNPLALARIIRGDPPASNRADVKSPFLFRGNGLSESSVPAQAPPQDETPSQPAPAISPACPYSFSLGFQAASAVDAGEMLKEIL